MPQEKYKFLVDKQAFRKMSVTTPSSEDLSIQIDLPKREISSFRLYLRPVKVEDLPDYYRLYSDTTVMSKYCDGNTRSIHEVDKLMSNYLGQDEPSYFSIFKKETNSFIGTIFLTTRNQEPGEILLGYLIHKDYWGNNYAKEALYGLLYCLFPITRSDITIVSATTRDDNIASKKILESFCFECVEEVEKFDQKRLLYKADVINIRKIHLNIEVQEQVLKKNLGAAFLVGSELLDNTNTYKYVVKQIIFPIIPYNFSSQFDELLILVPQDRFFWISTHFILDSIGYYCLFDQGFSFIPTYVLPIVSTSGYSIKLFINDYYQSLSQQRMYDVINATHNEDIYFFNHCFSEVALNTVASFVFSLPTILSFPSIGFYYTSFSTITALTTSSINCAASNKRIVESDNNMLISKILPYFVDLIVGFTTLRTLEFESFHNGPSTLLNIKKTSVLFSSLVASDQLTKSLITLVPDESAQYFENLLGFDTFHNIEM